MTMLKITKSNNKMYYTDKITIVAILIQVLKIELL